MLNNRKNMNNKLAQIISLLLLVFFSTSTFVTPYAFARQEKADKEKKIQESVEKFFKKLQKKYPNLKLKLLENETGLVKIQSKDNVLTIEKGNLSFVSSNGEKEEMSTEEEMQIFKKHKNDQKKAILLSLKSFIKKLDKLEKSKKEETTSFLNDIFNLLIPSAQAEYKYGQYDDSKEVKQLEILKKVAFVIGLVFSIVVIGGIVAATGWAAIPALILGIILDMIIMGPTFYKIDDVIEKLIEKKDIEYETTKKDEKKEDPAQAPVDETQPVQEPSDENNQEV